ncbi:MAG: hypothetical protein CMH52_03230 [Myxococcales bacterium]|nr:hypothetical protein [Myxococcales bacterium]|tara:strand:- start:64 stop:273 length:210 start_codon:yes stop_codon:yes gene_type:complete
MQVGIHAVVAFFVEATWAICLPHHLDESGSRLSTPISPLRFGTESLLAFTQDIGSDVLDLSYFLLFLEG